MSVLGNLIAVSHDLLDLFKDYQELIFLYYGASNTREETNIGSISKLSRQHREIIRELYPENCNKVGQIWNLDNCKSVLRYKTYNPEKYHLIKENIPKIIESGKTARHFNLGRAWHLISFLFSGSISTEISDLVIWNEEFFGINPILYKKHTLESGYYYLTTDEIKILSEIMQDFADEIICENLKRIINLRGFIYWVSSYKLNSWQDESWLLYVKDLCNSTKDFYLEVANKERSVLISIR